MAPPGRQKSEREFCLFGGVFLRPACRAVCRAGRFCAACRSCGGFCARCSGIFLPVCRCLVPGLRAACCFCAWSGLCCRGLLAVCPPCVLCAHFRLVSAVCSPVLCCVRGFSLLSFTFSCLTFASQISFHLSLRPRRASTFFRKESRQRFAKGLGPFEPPFLRPAANLLLFRAAGRLNGPSGRNSPADGETLEKPRSKAQLFKRFCAKGDACALRLLTPFFSLLAGLTALRAAIRRLIRETLEKTKEQSSAFSSVSVRWGCAGAFARRVSSRPQGTGGRISPRPGKQEPCVGLPPEPAACVRDAGKKETRCANCPPQVRPKSQRSRAPAFRAFLCVGDAPGLLPGGFPPGRREQEVGFLPRPGKQKPGVGLAPGTSRVRARRGEERDTVRELPTAGAPEKPKEQSSSFSGVSVRWGTFGPTFYIFMEVWLGLLLGRREQKPSFSLPGKTEAQRGLAPGTSRVRARLGAGTNPVRELPTAGAPEKPKEQSSSFSGVSVRWGCAGAFARRVSSRPQGTGGRISPRPGKQEPCVGLHPEPAACVRD